MVSNPSNVNLHSPTAIGDVAPNTVGATNLLVTTNATGAGDENIIQIATSPDFGGAFACLFFGSTTGLATTQCIYQNASANQLNIRASGQILLGVGFTANVVTVTGSGFTLASGIALQLGNAAATGLTPGVLAATTNASIILKDSNGTSYRIPCII